MTADEIAARNRTNASRSTGPRTKDGKATVARNARRHGATAKPELDQVMAWLRIILSNPDLASPDTLTRDERTYVAVALAEAEARYIAAERALRDFEGGVAAPPADVQKLQEDAERILKRDRLYYMTPAEERSNLAYAARLMQVFGSMTKPGGMRHRLLRRYLAEARSRRAKAFAAWIAHERGGEDQRLAA